MIKTHKSQLQLFVEQELDKIKGGILPVHATRTERMMVRKVSCDKLHPNPDDEFCSPGIGPNEQIITQYEHDFRMIREDPGSPGLMDGKAREPLKVTKVHPDGYMILNGHHRWAAAVRSGIDRLPVSVVNLTLEKDIISILEHSSHERRVTLDLEEIVLAPSMDGLMEKPLPFPFRMLYRGSLRLGIPALFRSISLNGYDIWLYSSDYLSSDDVRTLLRMYRVKVTGIVTGNRSMEKLIVRKYPRTVHADNHEVVCVDSVKKSFREYPVNESALWSAEVKKIIETITWDE